MNFVNAMFLCYLRPEKCQKSYPERHEYRQCHVSLLPEAREMPKSYPETHEFWQRHVSSLPEAREMPKILERHEFQQRHNSSLPRARESPNPTTKDTNFAQKLHSLTPAKMPRKVFSFPEFRTSFFTKCTH